MLTARISSGISLVGIITVFVFWRSTVADLGFLALGCVAVALGLREYFQMTSAMGYPGYPRLSVAAALLTIVVVALFMGAETFGSARGAAAEILVIGVALLAGFLRIFGASDQRQACLNLLVSIAGFVYIGWTLTFLLKTFFIGAGLVRSGPFLVMFLILVTKFGDIGGFTVGNLSQRLLGGNHKITPRLSPKKSWEGLAGSALFSVGIAWLLVVWLGPRLYLNGQQILPLPAALLLAVLLAVVGFFGDLAASILKRASGRKDSGAAIPGMGGALDVLDSLTLVSPLFYGLLLFAGAM